jgi:aryl-phospho-beta-D-glucosidase BglC (GH1 family)
VDGVLRAVLLRRFVQWSHKVSIYVLIDLMY